MSENEEPDELDQIIKEFTKNPHDAAFKRIMKRKKVLIPYIRSKLPPSLVKRIHWDQLSFEPTNFLDEHFKEQRCDLLIKLPYGKGDACFVHLLFEHQRLHDPTMPFRLLKYMVSIWTEIEQERADQYNEQAKKGIPAKERVKIYPLPSVFPLVYYNGKDRWTTPTDFHQSQLIDIPPGMSSYTPRFKHELSDLRRMKEEDFEQYKENRHCYYQLRFFAHMQSGETVEAFLSMIDYMQDVSKNDQYIYDLMVLLAFHVEPQATSPKGEVHKTISSNNTKLSKSLNRRLIKEKACHLFWKNIVNKVEKKVLTLTHSKPLRKCLIKDVN